MKQSKKPPKVEPQPYLLALMPSKASMREENIIDSPNARQNVSLTSPPDLPFSPMKGGFSLKKKSQILIASIGSGPEQVKKFALSLQ
jgi:hypothetical protein